MLLAIIFVISAIILGCMLLFFPYGVDKKLEMYKEENSNIELKVKETVRAYMDYEKETYSNLIENADLTTLLVKYPELNSNELVKAEIDTYKDNSKKIKELKEKQINRSIMAWWIYFGN